MTEPIKVKHCIWISKYSVILRKQWDFKERRRKEGIEIYEIKLPLDFWYLLDKTTSKGKIKEFSIAHNIDRGIWSIAIVNPKDTFDRKKGYHIVMGRMLKMMAGKYNTPIPETIAIVGDDL